MHTHVAKWGASCAIRLPKMAVETLGLHAGQPISILIEGDHLILKKDRPEYNLADLVAQMNPEYAPESMLDDTQGEELL
jgi:antitoxin component of MazEF toxin-antitoxin module